LENKDLIIDIMMSTDSHSSSEIQEILRMKNVAVVGMSNTEGKPANFVPKYLTKLVLVKVSLTR
jgi:hypothetical protein